MRITYKHVTLLFLFTIVALISAAQVNRTKMVGAYVHNFSRYTTWPNEAKLDSFRIVLVSDDKGLIAEFKDFSKNLKEKEAPISLVIVKSVSVLKSPYPNLIFIDNNNSGLLTEIQKQISDYPILVVTENSEDRQHVMINLYDSPEQELLFEVNKANVINQNLKIDPEILLLGGTEIDVAGLYRTSQKEIEQLQLRFNAMNDSLDDLREIISRSLLQIEKQQAEMLKQETLLMGQSRELVIGKKEIEEQHREIGFQQSELVRQKEQMEVQSEAIREQVIELSEQQAYNLRQLARISQGKNTLDSLMIEIGNKNIILDEQSITIGRQKQNLILAIIIGILGLIVLITMVNSYRHKVKKNRLLVRQKEEIEVINKKLTAVNKSLFLTLGQLKETQSQLVSSEKMASLGVLTAGIAHEINNPVNFIYTGINCLKKDYEELVPLLTTIGDLSDESDQEKLKTQLIAMRDEIDFNDILEIIPQTIVDIQVGAERATDIIRGLRNFSRIDKDSRQLSDIHEGIDTALLLLRNKFKNTIQIEKHYAQLPKIECFPGKLNQAFLNIISNSIDAIDHEGKIIITTKTDEKFIYISFEDNGKGISANNIDNIFDPFFTTKSVGDGVGLGLSITFGIIQEHQGKIEVKSTENVGTIFTISLPCDF